MKSILATLGSVFLSALTFSSAARAQAASDFASALAAGEPHLMIRYRYEWVDQDSIPKDANASTVRLRLNYETGNW